MDRQAHCTLGQFSITIRLEDKELRVRVQSDYRLYKGSIEEKQEGPMFFGNCHAMLDAVKDLIKTQAKQNKVPFELKEDTEQLILRCPVKIADKDKVKEFTIQLEPSNLDQTERLTMRVEVLERELRKAH